MFVWYLGAALWVGAAAFFWQAVRSMWGGAATRLPAGHPPDFPRPRPTSATPLPGITPPDDGQRAASDRAEEKDFTDELHESVAGVFGTMKMVVVVCMIAVLALVAQFCMVLGIWFLFSGELLESAGSLAFVGFLIWFILVLLRHGTRKSMLNQVRDDGGGE